MAIMSVARGQTAKAIHPGEPIGEFKLLAVSKDGIDLEWRDQRVHKKLDELKPQGAGRTGASGAGSRCGGSGGASSSATSGGSRTGHRRPGQWNPQV